MIKYCKCCNRLHNPDLALIEEFLSKGVIPPNSKSTKLELEEWIETHVKLLNQLRQLHFQIYAAYLAVPPTPE